MCLSLFNRLPKLFSKSCGDDGICMTLYSMSSTDEYICQEKNIFFQPDEDMLLFNEIYIYKVNYSVYV